jgi:hypothetical protein
VLCDQRLRSGESGFEILKALLERLPKVSGAMVSGEFNSPVLRDAEEEGIWCCASRWSLQRCMLC